MLAASATLLSRKILSFRPESCSIGFVLGEHGGYLFIGVKDEVLPRRVPCVT